MRNLIFSVLAACSIFSAGTQALTITNADAFTTGDGKAIYDTTSGLTWLDFGINNTLSFDAATSTLGQGQYNGWRLPTETEVLNLFAGLLPELAIPTTLAEPIQTQYQTDNFELIWGDIFSLWGVNFAQPDPNERDNQPWFSFANIGMFLGDDGLIYETGMHEFTFSTDTGGGNIYYGHIISFNAQESYFYNDALIYQSTLLVRDSPQATVSEPTTLVLLMLGMFGVLVKRNRQKQ